MAITVEAVEADESGRGPGVAAGGLGDLEHRAAEAIRPAYGGRAKQVAAASMIKRASGFAPSAPLKLTSGVRLAACDCPGATATIARPITAANDKTVLRIGVPPVVPVHLPLSGPSWFPK